MNESRRRTVGWIAPLILAVAACTGAAPAATPPPDGSTAVNLRDFSIGPAGLTIADGATLAVRNDGPSTHNLTIRDATGATLIATKDLPAGGTQALSVKVGPGVYVLLCSIPGHEGLGMKGTLAVTP